MSPASLPRKLFTCTGSQLTPAAAAHPASALFPSQRRLGHVLKGSVGAATGHPASAFVLWITWTRSLGGKGGPTGTELALEVRAEWLKRSGPLVGSLDQRVCSGSERFGHHPTWPCLWHCVYPVGRTDGFCSWSLCDYQRSRAFGKVFNGICHIPFYTVRHYSTAPPFIARFTTNNTRHWLSL